MWTRESLPSRTSDTGASLEINEQVDLGVRAAHLATHGVPLLSPRPDG